MLKTLCAVAAASLAAVGIAATAPSAQAAAHPAGTVYVHGTTRLASFTTRAACATHAQASYNLVVSKKSVATPLAGYALEPSNTPTRFQCYPVRTNRWSYVTAYVSKTGAPLASRDIYISPTGRQMDDTVYADSENLWFYVHANLSRKGDITQAKCDTNARNLAASVLKNPKDRLLYGDTSCYTDDQGGLGYEVDYLGVDNASGVTTDKAFTGPSVAPMLDVLGYEFPTGSSTHRSQLRTLLGSK